MKQQLIKQKEDSKQVGTEIDKEINDIETQQTKKQSKKEKDENSSENLNNKPNTSDLKVLMGCFLKKHSSQCYNSGTQNLSFQLKSLSAYDYQEDKTPWLKQFYQQLSKITTSSFKIQSAEKIYCYECILLIEIWKNVDNIPILDKLYLEHLVVKILNENYKIPLTQIEVQINGEVNLQSYPYLAIFNVKLQLRNQTELDSLNQLNKHYTLVDEKTIFNYLVHFEPINTQSTSNSPQNNCVKGEKMELLEQNNEEMLPSLPQLKKQKTQYDQVEVQYKQLSEDYYLIANIADKDDGKNKYGLIQLIKSKKENKVYALKKICNLFPEQLDRLIQNKLGGCQCDIDDSNINGSTNNPIREFKFILTMRKNQIEHKNIVKFYNYEVSPAERSIGLVLEYFGGTDFKSTSIFKFFDQGLHKDLGYEDRVVSKVISFIFKQILDAAEFFHKYSESLRDLRDDNILVRRRVNEEFEIALADFGLNGKICKTSSIAKYNTYLFRDPLISGENYKQLKTLYTEKHDIYSLGIILRRLYCLYYRSFILDKQFNIGQNAPLSYLQGEDYEYLKAIIDKIMVPKFPADVELINLMCGSDLQGLNPKSPQRSKEVLEQQFLRRPANIGALRKTQQYQNWITQHNKIQLINTQIN